jgi:hypothetical protein
MSRSHRIAGLTGIVFLFFAAGCGPAKLNSEHSFTVPSGEDVAKIVNLTAQSVEQSVKVEITSDKPVDVFVLLAKNLPKDEADFTAEKLQPLAVTSKRDSTQDTLSAKIPANSDWHVIVMAGAKTMKATGKLKLSN